MLYAMPQSLSSLPVHLIFSTKDRCPFLGKSDLLQPTHAYLGGILRQVQCPAITIGSGLQLAPTQNVVKGRNPQKQLFSVPEIPRNASFCLARWLWLFLDLEIPGRDLGAIHCRPSRASSKDRFPRKLREILHKYVAFDERYLWD